MGAQTQRGAATRLMIVPTLHRLGHDIPNLTVISADATTFVSIFEKMKPWNG
jgi:hypothetical protein